MNMALYEIKQDCRIANKEYQKWDVVSDTEVGWFYPTVMTPTNWQPVKEVKKEEKPEITNEEKVEKKVEEKPAKKQRKKK